jgi:hypothetical protein
MDVTNSMIISHLNQSKQSNDILALMFCEFDNVEGPKILFQVPSNVINKVTFDSISSYIIPKDQLKNRIITITVGVYRIVGFPIYIEHPKYKRNKYMFNSCFIFDQNTNTCSYEAVVKKLASDLKTLEVESCFLSTEKTKKDDLPKLLRQIQLNLNTTDECIIQKIGNLEHSAIFLKQIKNHMDPQIVQSSDVPVFTINQHEFEIDDWDLTTKRIVQAINGFKTVSLLADETSIDSSIVKESVQNLLYAGVIMLVPIIQYSSMFAKTSNLIQYYSNPEIQSDSISFVRLDKEKEAPTFYDIFTFYNYFDNGVTFQDINEMYNPHEKNIDIRKLILFGLIKGYLKKINKYPVCLQDQQSQAGYSKKWLTGFYNYDKICSSLGYSTQTIEEQLDQDPTVVIIVK